MSVTFINTNVVMIYVNFWAYLGLNISTIRRDGVKSIMPSNSASKYL